MELCSIEILWKAGKQALNNENYWAALAIALMIPSVCSRIEYASDKYCDKKGLNGYWKIDKNGYKRWNDHKCYVDFCNFIIPNDSDSEFVELLGKNFSEVLYKMRCGIVHEGKPILETSKKVFLNIYDERNVEYEDKIIVSLQTICNGIFEYTYNWIHNNNSKLIYIPVVSYYDFKTQKDNR